MCDFFWQRVETTDQGDLADIVRASGVSGPSTSSKTTDILPSSTGIDSWQQLLHSQDQQAAVTAFPPLPADDLIGSGSGCGNPLFGNLRDPLLHEMAAGAGGFFEGSADAQKILVENDVKRPCSNLFSRVLQISPNKGSQLTPIRPPPVVDHGMQISSPRTPGIKRRKSQAKKVVCIPAPAAASNRSSGEVVPSDLWAWRKYGQKPIKGSPYPRGYYRCSSSKGCSARKQVERSRTDPNMLVITYTSEHNHPWPTQRNALAGSTRAQPAKSGTASTSKSSQYHNQRIAAAAAMKEEPKETTTTTTSSGLAIVKEEVVVGDMEKAEVDVSDTAANDQASFDQMFFNGTMMNESNHSDDFFADLAELDPDPMSLIFSRPGLEDDQEKDRNKAAGNSFIDIFDWGSGSSFGDQTKKGL